MPGKLSASASQSNTQQVAKALLGAAGPHPTLLVISPDRTRKERFIAKYLETFAHVLGNDSLVNSFDCRELDSAMKGAIREAARTLSLFSAKQFVVLDHLDSLKPAEAKEIMEIVSEGDEGSCIIGSCAKLGVSSPLYKSFQKRGEVIVFEELKGEAFRRWAERECVQKGINSISNAALTLLIQMSQGDVDCMAQLIDVAALYAEENSITERDIHALFHVSLSHSEFALVDEVIAGSSQKARLLLAELLREGKNPFGLMAILVRSFSQVMTIRVELDKGRSENYVRDLLQLPPWQYNKLVTHARRIPVVRLKSALAHLLKADVRLKSRSISTEDILQDVVVSL